MMRIYDNGVYRDMTAEEIAEYEKSTELSPAEKIAQLKQKLDYSDYKTIKLAEVALSVFAQMCEKGFFTTENNGIDIVPFIREFEECAEVIKQKAEWRKEINLLEKEVK